MLTADVREKLDRELFGLFQSTRDSRIHFPSLRTETKRILDEFAEPSPNSGGLGNKLLYFGWEDWWNQAGHVFTALIYESKNSSITESSKSLHTAISAMVHLWCDGTMHRRVKLRNELQDALFDYFGLRDMLSPSDYAPGAAVGPTPASETSQQIPAKSSRKRGQKRGRKELSAEDSDQRLKLIAKWIRAKEAGVGQKEFCKSSNVTVKHLSRAIEWKATRIRRGQKAQPTKAVKRR